MMPILILAGLVVLALVVLAGVWMRLRRRGVPASQASRLAAQWSAAVAVHDPARRVMEAEKILDGALIALGFAGSFGDKLKRAGPRFRDVQSIWNAHKLRNRIAHEAGIAVSERDAERAIDAFRRALKDVGVSVIA